MRIRRGDRSDRRKAQQYYKKGLGRADCKEQAKGEMRYGAAKKGRGRSRAEGSAGLVIGWSTTRIVCARPGGRGRKGEEEMQRGNEKANCTDRNSCRRAARDLISVLWSAGRTEVATFDCWRAGMAGPVHAVPGANRVGGRFGRAAAETGGGRLTGCLAMPGRSERCRAETPASDVFQGRSQRFAALQLFGRLFRRQSQPASMGQSCRWSVSRGRGLLF